MTTYTHSEINQIAVNNGMTTKTVIEGVFTDTEKLVVFMGNLKTALFIMDNTTFNFTFEKAYNAATDKTSKHLPKIFKY
jgi:hypothetical protein